MSDLTSIRIPSEHDPFASFAMSNGDLWTVTYGADVYVTPVEPELDAIWFGKLASRYVQVTDDDRLIITLDVIDPEMARFVGSAWTFSPTGTVETMF